MSVGVRDINQILGYSFGNDFYRERNLQARELFRESIGLIERLI